LRPSSPPPPRPAPRPQIDLMTVYLEQIGVAGDVTQFFGVDKFRMVRGAFGQGLTRV
jgi:hypothetical protein